MPLPIIFVDFRNWPTEDLANVDMGLMRSFHDMLINRLAATPETWTGLAGQVMVVEAGEAGFKPASQASLEFLDFALRPVRRFRPGNVEILGDATLTDAGHCGASLILKNPAAAVLTLALDPDPAVGCSTPFICEILRTVGAATVQIALGPGLTNRNPDGHTRVIEGRSAVLRLEGTDVYFNGYTET